MSTALKVLRILAFEHHPSLSVYPICMLWHEPRKLMIHL